MPYQTGSVASFNALKSTIFSFLTSNGYTAESNIIKKGNLYAEFTDTLIELKMVGAKSSDGSGNLVETFEHATRGLYLNNSSSVGCTLRKDATLENLATVSMVFPITYHFHLATTPVDEFWCVIEYNGGYCQHLGFGNLVKAAEFTGGGFYTGSGNANSRNYHLVGSFNYERSYYQYGGGAPLAPFHLAETQWPYAGEFPGSAVHAEIEGFHWMHPVYIQYGLDNSPTTDTLPYENVVGAIGVYYGLDTYTREERYRAESPVNGISTLVPYRLYGTMANRNVCRLGDVHNLRWALIKNLSFGQVEDDGTDKWKFYPAFFKDPLASPTKDINSSSTTYANTGIYGFAIKYDGP